MLAALAAPGPAQEILAQLRLSDSKKQHQQKKTIPRIAVITLMGIPAKIEETLFGGDRAFSRAISAFFVAGVEPFPLFASLVLLLLSLLFEELLFFASCLGSFAKGSDAMGLSSSLESARFGDDSLLLE